MLYKFLDITYSIYIYMCNLIARLRGGRFAGIHFQNLVLEKMNMLPVKICVSEQLSLYGSPGQATITMSHASKFCAKGRSQSIHIFHLESNYLEKTGNIEPWPECPPEFLGLSNLQYKELFFESPTNQPFSNKYLITTPTNQRPIRIQ